MPKEPSVVPVIVCLCLSAACVAEQEEPYPVVPGSGSPSDGSQDGGAGQPCPQEAAPPDGHHNAGLNCLMCHTGTAAPRWTAAGTLYADKAGAAPVAGATVTITDANGKQVSIVTAINGNFWTSESLVPPLHPSASSCARSAAMTGSAAGACNDCHQASGSPGRIVLR